MKPLIHFNQVYLLKTGVAFPRQKTPIKKLAKKQGWLTNPGRSLGIEEKTIPALDEDSLTLAWQAASPIVQGFEEKIGALYFGSESPPYAVKPAVTLLKNFLNLPPTIFGADLEFACRAGLEAAIIIAEFVQNKSIDYGLAIGADTAQAKPGDILSLSASAAASAWLIGQQATDGALRFIAASSFITDTPDFFRHQLSPYPAHGGRFTGQPAYFHHLEKAYIQLSSTLSLKADQIAKVAIHAPNMKFPQRLAKKLGFTPRQVEPLIADKNGNPYTASVMVQGALKQEELRKGEKILLLSFGSGAGAIALLLEKI